MIKRYKFSIILFIATTSAVLFYFITEYIQMRFYYPHKPFYQILVEIIIELFDISESLPERRHPDSQSPVSIYTKLENQILDIWCTIYYDYNPANIMYPDPNNTQTYLINKAADKITIPQQLEPSITKNLNETQLIQQTVTKNVNLTTALTEQNKIQLTKEVVKKVVEDKDVEVELTADELRELEERKVVIIASVVVFILAILYKITK